jgi:hypothetical protein
MELQVTVPNAGTWNLINQAYQHGEKYQWAREAAVNSMQAKATWIEFGIEEQMLAAHGVAKRFVADNGIGMNEAQLIEFMSSFGGGGKPISVNENFGQGFKSSTFMWNPFGVVVVSWTPETPDGLMIWIKRGSDETDDEKNFYLREFLVRNADGEADVVNVVEPHFDNGLGIDLAKLRTPEIEAAGHGTVFLFLGDALDRNTDHGDYLKDEVSLRGIVQYLNKRFIRMPKDVTMRVTALETATTKEEPPKSWKKKAVLLPHGGQKTLHTRLVKGVFDFMPKPKDGDWINGNVTVDEHGTQVAWVLCDSAEVDGGGSYGPGGAHIFVQHQSTYADVLVQEAYNATSSVNLYRRFGINADNVAKRVWLCITPPAYQDGSSEWGVLPNPSRSMLVAKGGKELPWKEWSDEFYRQFPPEIQKAIDLDRAGMVNTSTKLYGRAKEVLSRLNMRMKTKRLVVLPDGSVPGAPDGGVTGKIRVGMGSGGKTGSGAGAGGSKANVGGSGDIPLLNPDAVAPHKGIEKKRGDGVPAVDWINGPDWEDPSTTAAVFVPNDNRLMDDGSYSDGAILVNLGFFMFPDEFAYWINEYPKAASGDVIAVVKDAYGLELITKVCHARKLQGQKVGVAVTKMGTPVRFSNTDVDRLLSPEGLTLAVLGLLNVEQRIRTVAGSKFGKMASSAA